MDDDGAPWIEIIRDFTALRALVFDQWSDPRHVEAWFAPQGFRVTRCDFRPEEGGSWRVEFASADAAYGESGTFLEVRRPDRLVFTLSQSGAGGPASETLVVVTFEEVAGGTRMVFRQSGFESRARWDDHVTGWEGCFDKLAAKLRGLEPMP